MSSLHHTFVIIAAVVRALVHRDRWALQRLADTAAAVTEIRASSA